MGDSKPESHLRYVRRLNQDATGIVTINIRSSQILVFWSSIHLITPIDPGWYFHAASVPGRTSKVDGQRRLDAEFNPADPQVRWQHAKIGSLGKVDLLLDAGKRHLFYVTPHEASRDDLVQNHRPWPFIFHSPRSPDEATLIEFRIWTPDPDCHHAKEAGTAKTHRTDPSLASFGPAEHNSTAAARTKAGKAVQDMVDAWALSGLIDGGAMIDTREFFAKWKFWCPRDQSSLNEPSLTPTNPYGGKPTQANWHYIIPAADEHGIPWTAGSLKNAIANGRAAALTVGQAIMLGGDLFKDPDQMEDKDAKRWENPEGIMKTYWEARKWLAAKKATLERAPAQGIGKGFWSGYQQRYGVVYLVFDLLARNPASQGASTVDEIRGAGRSGDYDSDLAWVIAFRNLVKQAAKVDAVVDLLRKASGENRFSEIHFLVQALGLTGATALESVKSMVPLLQDVDLHRDLTKAGFTDGEATYLAQTGPDSELVQIVVTNGRYATLGLTNWTHFSEGGLNFRTFAEFHEKALKSVMQQGKDESAAHPIPAKAVFLTSFGCHFLTDGFSASHMRVPRQRLGPFSAKLMHDVDGLVGLWVYHRPGGVEQNRATWRAYGDGYLRGSDLSDKQKSLLEEDASGDEIVHAGNLGKVEADPDMNFEHAAATVGSAFKQLHYQAHDIQYSPHAPEVSSPASTMVQGILDFNGPVGSDPSKATELKNENLAPGSAGQGSLWENVHMTIKDRIRFIRSLMPIPYEPRETGTFRQFANIPPLFSKDLKLTLDGTYMIDKSKGSGLFKGLEGTLRGYTHYAGFTLQVYWAHFGDLSFDYLAKNFDQYFYMIKFFCDVQGLEDYMDKSLLQVYDKLPEE